MRARFGMITLGVDDLDRAMTFYRDGLGFESEGIIGQEYERGAAVMFRLEDGLLLMLFSRADLGHDAGLAASPPSATEFSIGHNVSSEAEVVRRAERAGARVPMPPRKTFWGGYAGYFQDPDGHLWEVLYNQAFVPSSR